jgi:hypothetical protein
MSIDTAEKMEALRDECENQVITDGNQVWVDLRNTLEATIAYQRKKTDAAFRAAYGNKENDNA